VEVRQTSNLRRLRLGEEKRQKKPQDENIMAFPITYGGHKKPGEITTKIYNKPRLTEHK